MRKTRLAGGGAIQSKNIVQDVFFLKIFSLNSSPAISHGPFNSRSSYKIMQPTREREG